MYHIAVLTNRETQEAFYRERLSRFCLERGLFPKADCYRGQEVFFEVTRKNAPTNAVIALPGVDELNVRRSTCECFFRKRVSSGAASWIFPCMRFGCAWTTFCWNR